jgi:hypothetical protein
VPEEFADAYREAYQRALEHPDTAPPEPEQPETGASGSEAEPIGPVRQRPAGAHADWSAAERFEPEELDPVAGGGRWTEYAVESGWERYRGSRWFVPSLLLLAALILVLAAYGVGRLFATGVHDARPTAGETRGVTVPASDPEEKSPGSAQHSQQPQARKPKPPKARPAAPWRGKVTAVAPAGASAGCVDRPGVDAAGHRVTYQPRNAVDGRHDTAWRCPGRGIGQRLVVRLPRTVAVGAVGLVPGYAKTDPRSGADRYAENNRITAVRWRLGNGVSVVQHLDGAASDRSMQTVRVPRTRTHRIELQVLAVRQGPRNTTCVSEVRVGRAL